MKDQPATVDYTLWKLMAWTGPVFFIGFFFFWGVVADNLPPMAASASPQDMWQHYKDLRLPITLGMSVCMVLASCYMSFGAAVSRVMKRIEGADGWLSNLELMGATITYCPIVVACGIWLCCAIQIDQLTPEMVQFCYRLGWMIIDLAYMVTSWQILAVSIVFLRDRREKKLVPAWVCWWGFVTVASFFPVSLIPFFTSGPFAFHGLFNFWIAFFTWYIWIVAMSLFIIRAVGRLQIEEQGAAQPSVAQDASRLAGVH
ncbi:hypothetical protein SAMN04488038_10249 [Solimonas aquatica]|uniref:Frag1/DRAM/Sfk1 family protein n=1 Tax=Solimonas aquatica TaxID=489703 RepID=A0A1H9BDM1_9GAMM|nr:hypothetical protein [Solimonas aquatica]SEP86969.1 hypothetical protein SAMN04488038_10249 [Solimonas aquatica]